MGTFIPKQIRFSKFWLLFPHQYTIHVRKFDPFGYTAGQVVVLPFPFSDLTQNKYRPALLLADAGRGDWIACQITSNPFTDRRAIAVNEADFSAGNLQRLSYARPGKLFTAHELLFVNCAGTLAVEKLAEVRQAVISLIGGYVA